MHLHSFRGGHHDLLYCKTCSGEGLKLFGVTDNVDVVSNFIMATKSVEPIVIAVVHFGESTDHVVSVFNSL